MASTARCPLSASTTECPRVSKIAFMARRALASSSTTRMRAMVNPPMGVRMRKASVNRADESKWTSTESLAEICVNGIMGNTFAFQSRAVSVGNRDPSLNRDAAVVARNRARILAARRRRTSGAASPRRRHGGEHFGGDGQRLFLRFLAGLDNFDEHFLDLKKFLRIGGFLGAAHGGGKNCCNEIVYVGPRHWAPHRLRPTTH